MTDSEILGAIIEAVGSNNYAFSKKLGYKSHSSVYHVFNGRNNLEDGMKERILKAYPNVNYNFMENAELPILLDDSRAQAQMNLFDIVPDDKTGDLALLKKIVNIPDQLNRIESMLLELLEKNKK